MASFTTSSGRQPRGLMKINGTVTPGWIDMEVDNHGHQAADTFRVKIAAGALSQFAGPNGVVMDAAWFCSQTDLFAELYMGVPADASSFGPADLTSWIYGQADEIEFDPVRGIISLSGRDLTRLLIDTKTTMKWPEKTSSQIATLIAKSHGLTAVVTATTTKAGKFYELEHAKMAQEVSEWDILSHLANDEGFTVYVRGQTLYFQPKTDPSTATPYDLIWTPATAQTPKAANVQHIRLKRALTVSRGIEVEIRSWNKKSANGFVVKYPTGISTITAGKSKVGAGAQVYAKTIPNLTRDQAEKYAETWYAKLIQHEMQIDVTMPADNALDINSVIRLSGTGTAFDQIYYPDSISRRMSMSDGYTMNVAARNQSPDMADSQSLEEGEV